MTCTSDERPKIEYFGSLIILLELNGVRLLTVYKKKGEFSISSFLAAFPHGLLRLAAFATRNGALASRAISFLSIRSYSKKSSSLPLEATLGKLHQTTYNFTLHISTNP